MITRALRWLGGSSRLARPVRVFGLIAVLGVVTVAPGALHVGGGTGHSARTDDMVALTFDDGLNGDYTLGVAQALEARGAAGTFFIVGRTLAQQPEVARTLVAHGHLLANHTADHEKPAALDLTYRKLAEGQAQFAATVGQCPAFFRAPHGVYTALSWLAIRRTGVQVVNWDVEVRDWDATDPDDLARRVLAKVEGGSIVLLHDGRDGVPGRDRSVLVRAMPMILEGLQARGLRAVRLDQLLGTPGTLDRCP